MAYESYADATFYTGTYVVKVGGTAIADSALLTQLLFKASRLIDKLTLNKTKSFTLLTVEQQESIKYALCAQVEFEYNTGDPYKKNFKSGESGFSLGKFSFNNGATSKVDDVRKSDKVCPTTWDYLRDYGMTYRGANVLNEVDYDA